MPRNRLEDPFADCFDDESEPFYAPAARAFHASTVPATAVIDVNDVHAQFTFFGEALTGVVPNILNAIAAMASENIAPSCSAIIDNSAHEFSSIKEKFEALENVWIFYKTNSVHVEYHHAAYLQIIGLGMPIVPHLLRKLSEGDGDWIVALKFITGAMVSTPEMRGNFPAIRDAWTNWGELNGLRNEFRAEASGSCRIVNDALRQSRPVSGHVDKRSNALARRSGT
jgi:hypothetical protein